MDARTAGAEVTQIDPRGLAHLRAIFGSGGVHVLPDQICIPKAHEAFDAGGALKDVGKRQSVVEFAGKLAAFTQKLTG